MFYISLSFDKDTSVILPHYVMDKGTLSALHCSLKLDISYVLLISSGKNIEVYLLLDFRTCSHSEMSNFLVDWLFKQTNTSHLSPWTCVQLLTPRKFTSGKDKNKHNILKTTFIHRHLLTTEF